MIVQQNSGYLKLKKNFMAPFCGWGSTASRLQPLRGGTLLKPSKFTRVPNIPGLQKLLIMSGYA